MPYQEPARSPARRQIPPDRTPPSHSVSRDPLYPEHLLNTHKGSSTKLHKAHAVGQGRHGHNRVPSYGKGLNKLSKLGAGNTGEEVRQIRHHSRSASNTPPASPGNLSHKRNNSSISLQRPSSKGSMKRNSSHSAPSRNDSASKLGNQPKSEKAQIKINLMKKGTDDAPITGMARFEVGDEAQDDEWTEDSSSQSPVTNRTDSRPKTPVTLTPKELPTPDEPSERRSPTLPDSPPDSPPSNHSPPADRTADSRTKMNMNRENSYSHPPDANAVTNRLLNRNEVHVSATQTSTGSANITPHVGSSELSHSQASTIINEPSLLADGISRFLSSANSNSGSATPGSVSQLQQNIMNIDRDDIRLSSPKNSASLTSKGEARRVKSAANLTHERLNNGENISPPRSPQTDRRPLPQKRRSRINQSYMPSPFESARGADPSAGKSYTQLKLNLDREAVSRDPPLSSHPLLINQGSILNMAGTISANASDMEKRLRRQYSQAQKDVKNSRRYYPTVVAGKISEKPIRRYQLERERIKKGQEKEKRDPGSSAGSPAEATKTMESLSHTPRGMQPRGRVRFEVGTRSFEDNHTNRPEISRGDGHDSVEGLLKRMWIAPEPKEEDEGD